MISNYLKGLKRELSKTTLIIESATPLSSTEMNQIKKNFASKFINHQSLTINHSLLGGLRVKIGDEVYDYSVSGKLKQVKEAIHG